MELSDFVTVIVPFTYSQQQLDTQIAVYMDILSGVGLPKPQIVSANNKSQEDIACEVAEIVGEDRSVSISPKHYIAAFCYNDGETAFVTFDSHRDYYITMHPTFGNGSFLRYRNGEIYIVGSDMEFIGPNPPKQIKVYPPKKIDRVIQADIPPKIFLSLDIDVFDEEVTKAHNWPHDGLVERFERAIGIKTHLSFEEVLTLSQQLLQGRTLMGVNIAEYCPQLEQPPYKTAELLKQYLRAVLHAGVPLQAH